MKTLVNPRGSPLRLVLSDGSERVVPGWGVAIVPDQDRDGRPLQVRRAEPLLSNQDGKLSSAA